MAPSTVCRYFVPVMSIFVLAACAAGPIGVPLRTTTQFEVELQRYRELPPHRAFAIAGNPDRVYVSGYSYGQPSPSAARKAALQYCRQRQVDRGIGSPCKLYAVGDDMDPNGSQQVRHPQN